MAEGGRIDYDIGLDASRASAELEKLKGQLNRLTADFQNATNTIKNNVEKMTRDLRQGSDPVSIRRYDNALARSFSTQGRGSFNTQLSEAATRQIISESKAAAENTTARISNELVNQFGMRLRNMDDMVQARLRREVSRTRRYMTGSSPELLQAQEVLQQRRNESALREARYGRGAVINDNVWERFNHRGGADMMALQGRLMGNAMALSMLWNVMSSGRQFVVELDREFRQFQAITATTNSEMETLSGRLIDVSEKTKFTALEVAQAATVMGQAGLSAREVGDSIQAVTLLATASGSDLQQSVDISTSVLSIFNLQASEMANVANVLTAALNGSKLTLDKLTLGMQYSGNVAAQLGITYQELVATLGALANSGIRSGSTLGTGLRQLLIDIQNPSKAFRGVMQNTGLTDEDLNVQSQGLLTVLNNLKEAGIGAAQAFEIFQVRSAAAFVALSNNLDTAKLLEQELLLTSAAVEANATQMQSLANTYDKLTSVVGTLAFEAFEPLTKVLQRGIDSAANFLSILRQYPEVLNTIGILVGTIAAATIFSTLGAMVRGLAGMVPIFATFSKGAQGSALAMTSLGTAAASTGGILRGLWAVVARHPLVMMLTLLSSAVMGIEAFLEKTDTIADRIDYLKGKINETQGEIDTLNSQADAIDQTIGNLINQKAALDRDPLMRQTKILEVVLSFKELAQEIDYTTSSVDDLISALNNLQSIDMGKALPHYKQMVDNIEVLLETQQRQLDMLRTQNRDFFQEVQGSQNGTKLFGIFDLGWGTAMTQGDVINQYSKIDPNMGRIAQMMMPGVPGSPTMSNDYTEALGVQGEVLSAIATREGELGQLIHQRDVLRRSLTDEETARVAQLENELTALRILSTHVEKRVAIITEMTANEAKLERARQQELEAQIVAHEDFAAIQNWTRHALADTSERLSTFLKSSRDLSPQEQRDGVQELADALKDTQDAVFESIDILVAELKQADPDIDEEQARIMLRGKIEALTAQSQLNLMQQTDKLNEVVRQIEEKEAKDQIDTLQKELVRITRNAGKARSQEELEEYREHALQVLDKIRELHTTIYNLVNEDADPEEVLKNNSDFQKTLASINEKEQEITEGLEERSRRLVDNHYKAVQDSLNDEIKATEKKLKEINDQIKKTNPGAALDALVAQWKELFAHLQQLLGFDNAVEFQQGMHSARMPIPKGSAVRANEAMQHYLAAGLPKHIAAGIVGNLLVESGLKTGAVGDNGTAFGLAQWRLDRNTNMRAFANQRGVPWTDTKAQLDFVLHEMQGPYKHVMEALLKTQTADQATKVFMDLYERPNKDPKINHIDRRRGYASELASMDYHSQAQSLSDAQTTHDDALKSTIERSTKNAVAAAVNNANKQIQAAIAQAKASPDLGVINNLITEVDDRFKEVLEQRLKEFDTVNKKALEEGDEAVILQRQQLVESLNADRNQKISQLLEEYYKTLDDQLSRPVEDARARLDAAQRPENEGRFTSIDIASMEENVRIAEREELIKRLAAAEEHLARVREELARYEAGSTEHTYWLNEEARARERVAELQRQQNIEHQIANQQMPSINQRIMEANIQWGIQNGLLQQNAKSMADMVPLADQVGQAWGQILDGLTNAFSQLFMDLASGTMSAEEAFKKFGLSVIQMLMQMIAKALAYQMVMGLMGGGGGGSSLFGGLMTGLFGVPGMANGGRVRGAATGEFIQGGVPTRDSVLRSVMPGEFILRRSAVQAIGEENLTALNNAGNRINSPGIAPMLEQQQAGVPQTLNVWVVSPDQQPPPGPNDIVAVVADNISRRGSLKALIQQVQTGTI